MAQKKPKVCVLQAAGINRDIEAKRAFTVAGATADLIHINDLISGRQRLDGYHILMLPGGFSFGDDIASGKVLANKLKYKLAGPIKEFVGKGKLVLGICNGFQAMVKMGLLPGVGGDYQNQRVTLTYNDSGKFEDRWVYLKINPKSKCIFTQGLDRVVYMPVCHGEGKFIPQDKEMLSRLHQNEQVVAQYVNEDGNFGSYPVNPNGSVNHIAGICDETGLIFGMMPHPEDYITLTHHPRWTRGKLLHSKDGLLIFENTVRYAQQNLL